MDSLLATYASSDEDADESIPSPAPAPATRRGEASGKSAGGIFSALPQPKSAPIFSSIPAPKSAATFSSIPPPKSPASSGNPKGVVQFRPPPIRQTTGVSSDEEDDAEKRRTSASEAPPPLSAGSGPVSSFLPAPRHSLGFGSGAARRSAVDTAGPERSNLGAAGPSSSAVNRGAPERSDTGPAEEDDPEESSGEDGMPAPAEPGLLPPPCPNPPPAPPFRIRRRMAAFGGNGYCYSSGSEDEEEEEEGAEGYRKGGYHAARPGDRFAGGRFVAQRKLGWGNFSTVWLAYDTLLSRFVALKIQKSARDYAHAALHEIELLSAAAKGDPTNSKCVIQLLDHFKHAGPNGKHICLVTEFLGDSLLRLIRYNRNKGIGLSRVREICRSVLTGLDYMHRELGIIHTDLKPENVLLVSTINPSKDPVRSRLTPILKRPEGNQYRAPSMSFSEKMLKTRARRAVAKILQRRVSLGGFTTDMVKERSLDGISMKCKIVDFGNACWAEVQAQDGVIQTRQYRAPEVIIGSGYSYSADMWSFACMVFELATGDMLFAPNTCQGCSEDEDHLALMMETLGKMPKKIAISGTRSKDYFNRYGDLKRVPRLRFWPLERVLVERYGFTEPDAKGLADFLRPILDFDPDNRPTAAECLRHAWLN